VQPFNVTTSSSTPATSHVSIPGPPRTPASTRNRSRSFPASPHPVSLD